MTEPSDGPGPIDPTGHDAIDEALARLAHLDDLPVTQHVATYDAIHHIIRTTLADAGQPGTL